MEFCDQSWNFTNYAHRIVPNLYFFVTTKKLSSDLESPHFLRFSVKCHECKIKKRDGHGKSRNGHGKVMGKNVVESVGTLIMKSTYVIQHNYHPPLSSRWCAPSVSW